MRLAGALILLVACGNNNGGGDDGGTSGDAPNPGTPLEQRLTTTTITAPAGVIGGGANYRIWGQGNLKVGRVYTVPYPDCATLVGFTTGSAQSPEARVAKLNPLDSLDTTYDLGAFELRGLAVEPDGHFAALLWDQTAMSLHVQRFDKTGAAGWSTSLDDSVGKPTDFGIGESRLEYGNGVYEAYFHVHGYSGIFNGHEGDALHSLNATTGANATLWQWGCSHSMSELLTTSGTTILPICVTDCYPGTSGSNFATDSIGGVYLENSTKVLDVDGGCNGSVAAELGGAAPASAGWKLVFNAHQNPATNGQSSYVTATMNQDIGFASISANKSPSPVVWLTTTAGNEANSTIARWQPNDDTSEQYVVGWSDGSGGYQLARVSATGTFLEGPTATAAKWGERDDPFRTHVQADIVWSWFDAPLATSFHFARLHAGSSAACAPI